MPNHVAGLNVVREAKGSHAITCCMLKIARARKDNRLTPVYPTSLCHISEKKPRTAYQNMSSKRKMLNIGHVRNGKPLTPVYTICAVSYQRKRQRKSYRNPPRKRHVLIARGAQKDNLLTSVDAVFMVFCQGKNQQKNITDTRQTIEKCSTSSHRNPSRKKKMQTSYQSVNLSWEPVIQVASAKCYEYQTLRIARQEIVK